MNNLNINIQILRIKSLRDNKLGDSTDLAHNIIGLCYPQAFDLGMYRGYNVASLGNRFRGVKIIKNRDGNADVVFGAKFVGEIGTFEELPPSAPRFPGDILPIMNSTDYDKIRGITKYYKE